MHGGLVPRDTAPHALDHGNPVEADRVRNPARDLDILAE